MQRKAVKEQATERVRSRINRAKHSFLVDHPHRATKADALLLFEDIETVLDSSVRADEMRVEIRKIIESHDLNQDIAKQIDDYVSFADSLTQLAYHELREAQESQSI